MRRSHSQRNRAARISREWVTAMAHHRGFAWPTRTSGASPGGAASPAFRLTRSVGQVGRKSETTRVIARLQLEICAFPGTTADQLDKPAVPADARHRQRR
jgi:hypothetical protein